MTADPVLAGVFAPSGQFPCCDNEYFINCDKIYYRHNSGISDCYDSIWSAEELPKEIIHFKDVPKIINETIRIFANRASWLGNDELHYRRTWEDKDIFDLEALIEASILAIKIEEDGKKLKEEMPKPKKK